MAYGNEVMFVLDWPVLTRLAYEYLDETPHSEHLTDENVEFMRTNYDSIEDAEDRNEWRQMIADFASARVDDRLIQAHLDLIQVHFDPDARLNGSRSRYVLATTPEGRREFATFTIGGTGPEDEPPVYGISILSRYFPIWLDWRSAHGGSNDPVILDSETLEMAELARRAIAPVIPEIVDAPLAVVFTHY